MLFAMTKAFAAMLEGKHISQTIFPSRSSNSQGSCAKIYQTRVHSS
jgi:hypothetical protein